MPDRAYPDIAKMAGPIVRKRATHSKSHGACKTCRVRHVKCDEMQPSCQRCIKANRVCGGYKVPPRAIMQPRSIMPRPLPSAVAHNATDSMTLDFFRRTTIHMLPCASAFEKPWEQIVLNLLSQQPSIAAAASACASIHRASSEVHDHEQKNLALRQHVKSLSLLRAYIDNLNAGSSDEDVVVVLVACLLLFTYEAFCGEDAKASLHLHTGLRIVHDRRRPVEPSKTCNGRHVIVARSQPQNLFDVLVQTFIRLDSDYTLTGHDDPYLYPICRESMPAKFSDPDQASLHLEVITAKIFDFFDVFYLHAREQLSVDRNIEHLNDDQQDCLTRAALRTVPLDDELTEGLERTHRNLHSWMLAFAAVPLTHSNELSHISAQVFYFCVWIWAKTWRDATATLADRFQAQFEYFTGLCERYIDLHIAGASQRSTYFAVGKENWNDRDETPPAFSLGSGVVTCLVAIAEKCRTSTIRRRCISALRRINLRGVFDTEYLATYLTAIVELEEQGALLLCPDRTPGHSFHAHEIPEPARLLEVVMSPSYQSGNHDFYKAGWVGMVYVNRPSGQGLSALQIGGKVATITRERMGHAQATSRQVVSLSIASSMGGFGEIDMS